MHQRTATRAPHSRLLFILAIWFSIAFVLAISGVLAAARVLGPLAIIGSMGAGIVAYRRGGALREAADHLDLRWLIASHLVRVPIGVLLLLELSRGALPELFARRAGPGDIAAGLLAIAALAALPAATRARRRVVIAWNVFGLLDLALAVGTAMYLLVLVADPRMQAAARLPYALLPTFLVPVMALSHLLMLARLRRP